MDEEKVRGKPSYRESEANYPGDQSSPDNGDSDTFLTPESSNSSGSGGRKKNDVSPNEEINDSKKQDESKESAASVESVKESVKESVREAVSEAVSDLGTIADWKAHKVQTSERRKFIEQELAKSREEFPSFKEKSEVAEQAKEQALKDLDNSKRLIQELKLNLEKAETEERQAKEDSELAQLRVQELEQGVADESSVAAKTLLQVAKARHETASVELIAARNELQETRRDYEILVAERDSAVQKAQEAVSAVEELEGEVENLMIQLITTKEAIECIHVSHLEAEEQRIQEANERDHELLDLDHELQQAHEEFEKVKHKIAIAEDLKLKLATASKLLHSLKHELAIYMQGKMPEGEDGERFTRKDIQSGVAIAKNHLEEVNRNIEKTSEAITGLKTTAKSLTEELETERQVLLDIRKQKGLGAETVVNLESELKRTRLELENIREKEKEAREKLTELPKRLQKATDEAESAKLFAEGARLVMKRAKASTEQAKSELDSLTTRLTAIKNEIDAARAQERLALGAITALHESESSRGQTTKHPKDGITISLEEYYELSKRVHEAEEAANKQVAEAKARIDEAKASEMQSLRKLTQLNSKIAAQKEALNVALQKAETAKESKANLEKELRKRDGSSRETDGESQSGDSVSGKSGNAAKGDVSVSGSTSGGSKGFFKKKKKLFMPKISFMFLGKKKHANSHSNS